MPRHSMVTNWSPDGNYATRFAKAKARTIQMTTTISPAAPEQFFLQRFGLTERVLEQILGSAIARRADYADLYFEFRTLQSVSLEEGIVKTASHHVTQGVGVRVVAGDRTGYAYSDDVTVESLQLATRTAQA